MQVEKGRSLRFPTKTNITIPTHPDYTLERYKSKVNTFIEFVLLLPIITIRGGL
jgi:hypothetical protein